MLGITRYIRDALPKPMDHYSDWVNFGGSFHIYIHEPFDEKKSFEDADDKSLVDSDKLDEKVIFISSSEEDSFGNTLLPALQYQIRKNPMFYGGEESELQLIPSPGNLMRVLSLIFPNKSGWSNEGRVSGVGHSRISFRGYPYASPRLIPAELYRPVNPAIEKAIEEAADIADLPDNWDDEGGRKISSKLFAGAASFLRQYSDYLINLGFLMQAPQIDPCKDGTIDLAWRTERSRMLINIREYEGIPHAFFYGDKYNNKMPIKGNFPLSEFSEPLAAWMKHLV